MTPITRVASACTSILIALSLTSCKSVQQQSQATVHITLQGRVMGGEQPITASTIQLYEVGTSTDGGASTALINQTTTPVTTSDGTGQMNANANAGNNNNHMAAGFFTITGDYTCSPTNALVYIASINGNPGAGTNNVQTGIAAIGPCNTLTSSSFLTINEVTTVGTVRALSNYMTGYASVGSTSGHAAALATAFNTAGEYVQISNGTAPGPNLPSGYDASSNDLRALANVVQSCVNSNGSVANGSPCKTFFADAQGTASTLPVDTITALLDIFADPTNNVGPLFGLQPTTPAFQPTNVSAPTDWTLPILQVPGTPSISPNGGSITSSQNITITDSDTDGTNAIYYTTDGSTPSATNGTLYAGAFTLSASATVNAIDIDDNRLSSSLASAAFTVSSGGGTAPTVSLSPVASISGTTTPVTITATGNNNGALVTFGTAGSIVGSFSPTTCTLASGTCSVSYVPSGSLAVGTYTNDLTASFAAYGSYSAASATSTLTIGAAPTYGFSTLYSFGTQASDGYSADSTLIQASDGNFYGTTYGGGSSSYGTLFKLTPGGTYTTLYTFINGSDGGNPNAGVIQGRDGNLYGTTTEGGSSHSQGTIFEYVLTGPSAGFTTLYAFTGGADGGEPTGGVIQGADGNFYGLGEDGGGPNQGTIFEYAPGAGLTTLYTFTSSVGGLPAGRLLQGPDGNFYGTTQSGGSSGEGIVFELVPNGTNSTLTTLYSFTGNTDGGSPNSGLTQRADGNFYGTTSVGGSSYSGTIFELVPNGTNSTLTTLYNFTNGADGSTPEGGLLLGSDGNLYGTTYGQPGFPPFFPSTYGAVFELVPVGINSQLTVLHAFTGGSDGGNASGGLVQGSDGNLYGIATAGGTYSEGVIYKETPSPALSAPVTLTVPSSVTHGTSFTLSYAVSNAYSNTLQNCFASTTDSSGNFTLLGSLTGSATSQNASLTAPSTAGTYTLGVTCGGQESSTTTLTVQ